MKILGIFLCKNTHRRGPVTDISIFTLGSQIEFLKEQSFREARAAQDVKDVLEKLKIKAVSKIREYFLLKINQFKKPLANYQIPQNAMLRFKFYFRFLMKVNRDVASEVREEYVDTMSKVTATPGPCFC